MLYCSTDVLRSSTWERVPICLRLACYVKCNLSSTVPLPACFTADGLFSGSSSDSYDLTLGVAQRLDTGGLVKARMKHNGQLSLLYQQAITGLGQAAFTCNLDPMQLNKVAPTFGLSLTL